VTGNHHENVTHTVEAFTEIRTGKELRRKLYTREVSNVFPVLDHGLQQIELNNATEADVAARARELHRQRRSPGTGADDRNRFGGFVTY
jgi:hypothetical protein